VLFDLDGVLVDSRESVERHWISFAQRHRLPAHTVLGAIHGRRTSDTLREVAAHLDPAAEGLALDRAQAGDREGVRAIAGACELLEALGDASWTVVTSAPEFLARARMAHAGMPRSPLLVSGDAVTRGKPDPAGYLLAARRLRVAPKDCLVFEDSRVGAQAALVAGMWTIRVGVAEDWGELAPRVPVVDDLRSVEVVLAHADAIRLRIRTGRYLADDREATDALR
jgi:sugar-phosphatase